MTQATAPAQPLFYREPELLAPATHGGVRLQPAGYGFAADTNAVPVAVIEFGSAMRHYPLVFSQQDGFPIAVLGLDRWNRFVADGRWLEEELYVPAYVRRYPFAFAETSADRFILALDMAAEHIARDGAGEALFDAAGKPTATTENVMAFCRDFHGAHLQTRAFVEALLARDLLIEQHAAATLASGRQTTLRSFKVVDRTRFEALPDDVVIDWHRKGWLALIHFHLLSLERFADLLILENRAEEAEQSEKVTEDA